MDNQNTKTYISALLDFVFNLSHQRQFGVNHCEFLFVQIWSILSERPALKSWFLELVSKTVSNTSIDLSNEGVRPSWFVDGDLICFIAHLSRWSEFTEIADRRKFELKESGALTGSRDISDSILESMTDEWEDRDFYKLFAG